jgi:hypothetical protein
MFDLMNLCIKGSMYEFFVINRNLICVAQLLKGGKFSKIDHGCYEIYGEGKPRMVEMIQTRTVPTGCNFSIVLCRPRNELPVRMVVGRPSSRINEEMGQGTHL